MHALDVNLALLAGVWLLLALLALIAAAGVVRGGHREDVLLGYEDADTGPGRGTEPRTR